jgi:glucose/mannose-6-phosphate isomerase
VPAPQGAPDSDGMWEVTAALPEQVEHAAATARALEGLPSGEGVTNIVALGMGGSGIGADVLLAIAAPQAQVPVVVIKDYDLPAFVGPDSLVFASSFSGDTEETLAAATAAAHRGARLIAVTSGGKLAALAHEWDAPVVPLAAGIPHPRAAIGALAVPPIVLLERLGLLDTGDAVTNAVRQLKTRRDKLVGGSGDAAGIARRIGRTIPLFHGGGPLGAAAAARWKCQVNENPKSPAFWAVQPELCHNEVTGWGQHGDATRQLITLVTLRHDFEHPQVGRRFALVVELMREVVAGVVEVRAGGDGPLAQLFDLVLLGDFVALELAAREGIDPGPIPILTELKDALAPPATQATFP